MADTPGGGSTAARSRAHRTPEKVHLARPPNRKPNERDPVLDLGPDRLCRGSDAASGLWRDWKQDEENAAGTAWQTHPCSPSRMASTGRRPWKVCRSLEWAADQTDSSRL